MFQELLILIALSPEAQIHSLQCNQIMPKKVCSCMTTQLDKTINKREWLIINQTFLPGKTEIERRNNRNKFLRDNNIRQSTWNSIRNKIRIGMKKCGLTHKRQHPNRGKDI